MTEREQIKEELRKEYQELYMNESRFMKKISELFAQKAYDSLGNKVSRQTDIVSELLTTFNQNISREISRSNQRTIDETSRILFIKIYRSKYFIIMILLCALNLVTIIALFVLIFSK